MKGINNSFPISTPVREMVGKRIAAARNAKNLSRFALAELLIQNELCPAVTTRKNTSEIKTPAEALADRLKQWEYGNNPVDLEFIPAICKVLECDTGYLFAEYTEKNRVASDLCSVTGLSEKAIEYLCSIQKQGANPIFIDYLLCSENLPKLITIASDYSFAELVPLVAESNNMDHSSLDNECEIEKEVAEYRAFKTILDITRGFSTHIRKRYQERRESNG